MKRKVNITSTLYTEEQFTELKFIILEKAVTRSITNEVSEAEPIADDTIFQDERPRISTDLLKTLPPDQENDNTFNQLKEDLLFMPTHKTEQAYLSFLLDLLNPRCALCRDTIILMGRYRRLEKEKRDGICMGNDYDTRITIISQTYLRLIDELSITYLKNSLSLGDKY
jgi:hypothetical protein